MKDKLYTGLIPGLLAPFLVIALFYLFRFSYLTPGEFIQQAFTLKVYLKIIAVGIFFANLALFYLFLHYKKNNAAKGVILAVILFFFLMLILSL